MGCNHQPAPPRVDPPPQVETLIMRSRPVQPSIELTGAVVCQEIVRIHPEVTGTVQKVHSREGDTVTTGEILAEIDPKDFELELDIATSQRMRAGAEYRKFEEGYRTEDINVSESAYQNALASFRMKKINNDRNRNLYQSGVMTERDWKVYLEDLIALCGSRFVQA